jgi:hypothetical protein
MEFKTLFSYTSNQSSGVCVYLPRYFLNQTPRKYMKLNGLRKANITDYQDIIDLMENADHQNRIPLQWDRLESLLKEPKESLLVYESEGRIVGFMVAHFLAPCFQFEGEYQELENR